MHNVCILHYLSSRTQGQYCMYRYQKKLLTEISTAIRTHGLLGLGIASWIVQRPRRAFKTPWPVYVDTPHFDLAVPFTYRSDDAYRDRSLHL